jgi:hypothetical protein
MFASWLQKNETGSLNNTLSPRIMLSHLFCASVFYLWHVKTKNHINKYKLWYRNVVKYFLLLETFTMPAISAHARSTSPNKRSTVVHYSMGMVVAASTVHFFSCSSVEGFVACTLFFSTSHRKESGGLKFEGSACSRFNHSREHCRSGFRGEHSNRAIPYLQWRLPFSWCVSFHSYLGA